MKTLMFGLVGALALAALVPVAALAGGAKVKEADVPKAVIEAVKKRHPEGALKGFWRNGEAEEARYGMRVTEKKTVKVGDAEKEVRRTFDVTASSEGKILEEAEPLSVKALPEDVTKALTGSKYEKMAVKSARRVAPEGKAKSAFYDLVLADGERMLSVTLAKDGTLTEAAAPAESPPKEDAKEDGAEDKDSHDGCD